MHEIIPKNVLDKKSNTFSHAQVVRIILAVTASTFLAALDQTVVIPALPTIARDLHGYQQLSWVVAAYLITSTIAAPIYGKLSDVYGRRRILVVCIIIFTATSMLCGAAGSLSELVWFRAIQGLGGGGITALNQSVIADVVSPRERGRYQGYLSAVWAITALCGPIGGGLLIEGLSWRWIFWINLPMGLAAAWACHKALRCLVRPVHPRRPKLDVLGMLLLSGAITVLLLALGMTNTVSPQRSVEILILVGVGSGLLILLVAQERRAHDPLLPPRAFKSPSYVAHVALSTSIQLVMYICLFSIPLYFEFTRNSATAQSGMYLVPFMFSNAAGNVTGTQWVRRFGTFRGALHIATALIAAGLGLLAVLSLTAPAWVVISLIAVTGFGVGMGAIGSMMGTQNALITRDLGSGTGALLVLRSIGAASGASIAGAIITSNMMTTGHTMRTAAFSSACSSHARYGAIHRAAQFGSCGTFANMAGTFGMAYGVAAMVAGVSFVVTLLMPEIPLRKTPHSSEI